MSEELKPCPFCGTSDLLGFEPSHEGGWTIVKCRKCGGSGPAGLATSEQEAIARWNRRAQPAEAEGVERWNSLKLAAEVAEEDGPWEPRLGMTNCETAFAQSASPTKVLELIAALSAVTAERDRLQRNLNFTEQWYAERFERLTDLGKSAGCWDAMAAIIANGTADPYEPPTYAQQLVRAKHRADVVEAERDLLRAELETVKKVAYGNLELLDENAKLRAEVERYVPLHEAVQRAAGELPEGWAIQLYIERDGGGVELIGPDGTEDFATSNERLDYTVIDALEAAMAAKEA